MHRVEIDEVALSSLMDSIASDGLHQPIIVSALSEGYRLEAGHRRLIAHQRLRRLTIEAKIYEPSDHINGEAVRWAENLHREDLSPMEQGAAIAHAEDTLHYGRPQIAAMLHRSLDWVNQRRALCDLPDELAAAVHQRRLSIAGALELGRVTDAVHRDYLLRYTLDAGATVASVREWVRQWELARDRGEGATAPRPDPFVAGQAVVVMIPCCRCGVAQRHDHMRILRACAACTHAIAGSGSDPAGVRMTDAEDARERALD
jgi:ParB family chromosome partitioning protein